MKKIFTYCLLAVAALACAGTLTSCDDDYYDGPGYDFDTFIDSRLTGTWELVQANDMAVSSYDTNWLYFNGRGYGYYYYYRNGRLYREETRYYCQDAVYGSSRYQVNLFYQNGSSATMSYWFTGSTLWMQWVSNGRLVTYLYSPSANVPYY